MSAAKLAARARVWLHAAHDAVCDVVVPWEHGTVVRATRCPGYFDYNVVRVADEPGMSVRELSAFADEALAGLAHRRIDFDVVEAADERRAEFVARGWRAMRLVWMHHDGASRPRSESPVDEVPYEAVHDLRVQWGGEVNPVAPDDSYYAQAREVARVRRARVLAIRDAGAPVAFAQLERHGDGAEVSEVYVLPERRGCGLGTAVTRAAIHSAGDAADLWICADDEARAKELYARLGFRPVWRSMQLTRLC